MKVTIYHNPRCSKSRQTLALIEKKGIQPIIIKYMDNPPDFDTIKFILNALKVNIRSLLREEEPEYKNENVKLKNFNEQQLIDWLSRHPRVIQRPIVITSNGACICRPPENVLAILD
ncbi:MAG: arsenate reductase (glutaredoxin) [Pseudomonadota bacterium]|nr:arsenate reductase (glutaredoxin) [Pseudomonadota bacterium]